MSNFPNHVAGTRIYLSPLVKSDCAKLRQITDHPAITEIVIFLNTPFTKEDAASLIERNSGADEKLYAIRHKEDGLIGFFGVHLAAQQGIEVGYWLGVDYQGKGYASEALQTMTTAIAKAFPSHQIFAECNPANQKSWNLLCKNGFKSTGKDGHRVNRKKLIFSQ